VQGPEGVSLNYTSDVMSKAEEIILKEPDVVGTFAVGGFGFSGSNPNTGLIFTTLKPWEERKRPDQSVQAIIGKLFGAFAAIPEARLLPVNPPPIQGLGSFGGFTFQLQDRRGNESLDPLVQALGSDSRLS
jgi:HAE1 family hydrophobic/amphiphilic exporter-1